MNDLPSGCAKVTLGQCDELIREWRTYRQKELSHISNGRRLRILLCHSKDDKTNIRSLYDRLSAEKFIDPWLDEKKIVGGQDWDFEIRKAVRESDVVVVCISKSSINKEGYVQKEIRFALDVADEKPEGTIYIVPLRLEKCQVPTRLARWQWVDFFIEDGYDTLLKSLQQRAKALGIDTELNPQMQGVYVDVDAGDVFVNGKLVKELSDLEYRLLTFLYGRSGRLCDKYAITENVWGQVYEGETDDSRIKSLVSRLRSKIESDEAHPRYLVSVRNRGYKLIR